MEYRESEKESHWCTGLQHYWLRAITPEDAVHVVRLRKITTRTRYLHTIDTSVRGQELWIANDLVRADTRYFAIMHDHLMEGLIGLSHINLRQRSSEWGRWVVDRKSMAAVPSVVLIYDYCFSVLGLSKVYCRTVASNTAVISFHNSCGLAEGSTLKDFFIIDGEHCDAIEHVLRREEWEERRRDLVRRARQIDRPA